MPFGRHPLKMVCLPISPLPHWGEPSKYTKNDGRRGLGKVDQIRLEIRLLGSLLLAAQSLHPARKGLLVI